MNNNIYISDIFPNTMKSSETNKSDNHTGQGIGALVADEFSRLTHEYICLKTVEGMTFGLKDNLKDEYTQVFILTGDTSKAYLVSVNDKYNNELAIIADRYELNFLKKTPAPIIFPKDSENPNIIYCPGKDVILNYKQSIGQ